MEHKITSQDIAKLAGVSQSTVSRALNPDTSWQISPRKRDEIRRLCRQLGVMPSRSVKKYSFERTWRIAWLLGAMERDLNGMGRGAFFRKACDILQASGYTMELIRLEYAPEKQKASFRRIVNAGLADVYIVGAGMLDKQGLELLHKNSTRLILTLNGEMQCDPYPEHRWLSYFIHKNLEAYADAFSALPPEHLQKMAYLGKKTVSAQLKIAQLSSLQKTAGITGEEIGVFFLESAFCPIDLACRVAENFIFKNASVIERYQAFWCDGLSAYPLYDHLRRLGKIPGRDFSIVTDGVTGSLLPVIEPDIHLICRNVDLEAEKLCEQILRLIDNPQPETVVFKSVFRPAVYLEKKAVPDAVR